MEEQQPFTSCLHKQEQVKQAFALCTDKESKYLKIIELGKALPPLPEQEKRPENKVSGCQSTMYLATHFDKGLITFAATSDALISAGLAALLLAVYSGEAPETILMCPPTYLEELHISESLSPNRANGLYSIHLRMKQDALKHLYSRPS